MKVVVVEDQPLAREHMVEILRGISDIEVVAACENGMTAVERIAALEPDLVFLDVQMPEMSGFDVIEAIGVDRMPPVIFVTAFDMYAMKAFEVHALDYVLKPMSAAKLASVIARARKRLGGVSPTELTRHLTALLNLPEVSKTRDRFAIRTGGRLVFVPHREIQWIESCGNYATIQTGTGRFMIREPLTSLENRLGEEFRRVHRCTIVNLHRVREMQTAGKGEYDVIMSDGRRHRVSRKFRKPLETALATLQ
jgi:two-component system LytT family response regulator